MDQLGKIHWHHCKEQLKGIENDIECPIYMLESKKILSVYRKDSWERYLENGQMVINSGFPTVNCRKWFLLAEVSHDDAFVSFSF